MDKWADRGLLVIKSLMVIMMAIMVVLVFSNVVLRYGLGTGITFAEEISRWCFVWMIFLGSLIGLTNNGHLGYEGIFLKMPRMGQKVLYVVTRLIMLYITYMLVVGGWPQMVLNLNTKAPLSDLSVGWFFTSSELLFAVLSVPILLVDTYKALKGEFSAQSDHLDL